MSKSHLVFVYGTLKTGQPNGYRMPDVKTGNASFVGKAVTVSKWPLVIASRYNIPFLLYKESHGKVSNALIDCCLNLS